MKKQLFSMVLLATVFAFVLAACGNETSTATESEAQVEETTEVVTEDTPVDTMNVEAMEADSTEAISEEQ